jgi:Fic family protein
MQIVSGPIGKEIVHYVAPSSEMLDVEMKRFIDWFNETHPTTGSKKILGPVRAAIAHLYFECIHPFSDGNGRIGRAISEKALSQELGVPVLLKLSQSIWETKKEYYAQLSYASQGSLDITNWILYFVQVVRQAQLQAKETIQFVLRKSQFWKKYTSLLNERQEKVINRMFREGANGFEGGINTMKYMKIAECSKATATRDLSDLLRLGCTYQLPGGGRSTRYQINFETE